MHPNTFRSPSFSLKITFTHQQAILTMKMHKPALRTGLFPQTYDILRKATPTVLKTQCINDDHLPFREEVKNTEIGHLFEHILIDTMCLLKVKNGAKKALFAGRTSWNWREEPKGTFHITIDMHRSDERILWTSVSSSAQVIEAILASRSRSGRRVSN